MEEGNSSKLAEEILEVKGKEGITFSWLDGFCLMIDFTDIII